MLGPHVDRGRIPGDAEDMDAQDLGADDNSSPARGRAGFEPNSFQMIGYAQTFMGVAQSPGSTATVRSPPQ